MDGVSGSPQAGSVIVKTTSHRGFSVEHWADRCLEKIVYVAEDGNSIIKDQAMAFKANIRKVLIYYMTQAIKSDRTTLYNLFTQQDQGDMAEILRKL